MTTQVAPTLTMEQLETAMMADVVTRFANTWESTSRFSLLVKYEGKTTDEMARNGCKKVIIVNGHGGNEHLLTFFAQTQLEKAHDYVVYVFGLPERPAGGPPKKTSMDMHAGESETSTMLISRPDLVHLERAGKESGTDQARLSLPGTLYTAIWWYARFPEHYSGDGSAATRELGEYNMQAWIAAIQKAIQAVKSDKTSLQLQNEFFEKANDPLQTPQ